MERRARWTLWVVLGMAAIAAVLGTAFVWLVPNDDELALRLAAAAEAELGVKVTVGAVHWRMFPPALLIEDAATVQPLPIKFTRIEALPKWRELLQRRLVFDSVTVDGGVMPQMSLRELRVRPSPPGPDAAEPVVSQLRFRDVTWITRHGIPLEFDGHARFDAGWRPSEAELVRTGVESATQLSLARDGDADSWQVRIKLGGGTADGQVRLSAGKEGALRLSGELEPRDVEVAAALAAFKRKSIVSGKAMGRTTLSASGQSVGELARSLHTRTDFSVVSAALLHIDMDKAIRTYGKDRGGRTALQSLTGRMDTQNTPAGMVVTYSAIQAKGDAFSARGQGTIANRRIDGELTVDLVGGLAGVSLKVAGPLGAPQVTVPPAAMPGAALAGAGIALRKLFGTGDKPINRDSPR